MEKLANTLWRRGEGEGEEGWVESVGKRRDKQVCVLGEERGGERRVEFSKEGDVRCDPHISNTVTGALTHSLSSFTVGFIFVSCHCNGHLT